MESYLSFLALLCSPMLVATGGVYLVKYRVGDHQLKSPVSLRVCRYPGYTLSRQIESLDERIAADFTLLTVIPTVVIGSVWFGMPQPLGMAGNWVVGIIYTVVLCVFLWRLLNMVNDRRIKRMGLNGEQVVGHELAKLYEVGYRVFHDVPLDFGNVDHVVVGPAGVFAIETKYARKRIEKVDENGKENHKLSYDGEKVYLPTCETSEPIVQAKRQAREVSNRLSRVFGKMSVIPVVVYPGWFVEPVNADFETKVKNVKQLMGWLRKERRVMDDSRVEQVAAFFEEKCRDVEV